MRCLKIKIFGEVQGVFFRHSAKELAKELGIKGFIRNEPDGRTVYLEVEGEDEELEKFTNWCKRGPALARVEKAEIEEGEIKNFKDFYIEE
jgi:acylphosphatase